MSVFNRRARSAGPGEGRAVRGASLKASVHGLPAVVGPILRRRSIGVALAAAVAMLACSPATVRAGPPSVTQVRSLLQAYERDYFDARTHLAYSRKVGTRGTSGLPTPADVKAGLVNGQYLPWGYGAGLEDVGYHNGMLLMALCDAYAGTRDAEFARVARRTYSGMRLMSQVSPVAGFVPRGPHPDDTTAYYRDSSVDQHTLYLCGLWRYSKSGLATDAERTEIREIADSVVRRIQNYNYSILAEDGVTPAHAGGSLTSFTNASTALALLSLVGIAADLTGDPHWKTTYETLSTQRDAQNRNRWTTIANDNPAASNLFPRYNIFNNQDVVRTNILARIERDPTRFAALATRLDRIASDMNNGPALKLFRSSFGEAPGATADQILQTNLNTLAAFGTTLAATANTNDVYDAFEFSSLAQGPAELKNRYMEMSLTVPAVAWHAGMLSGVRTMREQTETRVADMVQTYSYNSVTSAWTNNYEVLAALWSQASGPPPVVPEPGPFAGTTAAMSVVLLRRRSRLRYEVTGG